jgi:hypothetical protein
MSILGKFFPADLKKSVTKSVSIQILKIGALKFNEKLETFMNQNSNRAAMAWLNNETELILTWHRLLVWWCALILGIGEKNTFERVL